MNCTHFSCDVFGIHLVRVGTEGGMCPRTCTRVGAIADFQNVARKPRGEQRVESTLDLDDGLGGHRTGGSEWISPNVYPHTIGGKIVE